MLHSVFGWVSSMCSCHAFYYGRSTLCQCDACWFRASYHGGVRFIYSGRSDRALRDPHGGRDRGHGQPGHAQVPQPQLWREGHKSLLESDTEFKHSMQRAHLSRTGWEDQEDQHLHDRGSLPLRLLSMRDTCLFTSFWIIIFSIIVVWKFSKYKTELAVLGWSFSQYMRDTRVFKHLIKFI